MRELISNTINVFLIATILYASARSAYAKQDNCEPEVDLGNRFEIRTDYIKDLEAISPGLRWVWHYNDNFFSEIQSSTVTTQSQDLVPDFSDSKMATFYEEKIIKPNLLSLRMDNDDFNPFVGFTLEYREIRRAELGYLAMPDSFGGDTVAFENNIDIEAVMPYARVGFDAELGSIFIYSYFDYLPYYNLKTHQETFFKPIVDNAARYSSEHKQDSGYTYYFEVLIQTGLIFSILAQFETSAWSTAYGMKTLAYDGTSFGFNVSNVDVSYHTHSLSFNLVIARIKIFTSLKPFIGYGYNWQKSVDSINSVTEKTKAATWNFGLRYN